MLREDEVELLDALGEVATKFAALEQEHRSDVADFVYAIHLAQNIIMARQGMRDYRILKGLPEDWKRPTE